VSKKKEDTPPLPPDTPSISPHFSSPGYVSRTLFMNHEDNYYPPHLRANGAIICVFFVKSAPVKGYNMQNKAHRETFSPRVIV